MQQIPYIDEKKPIPDDFNAKNEKKLERKRKQPKTKEEIRENSKRIMGKPYKVVSNENI